jgi:hypothetical protein
MDRRYAIIIIKHLGEVCYRAAQGPVSDKLALFKVYFKMKLSWPRRPPMLMKIGSFVDLFTYQYPAASCGVFILK